MKIGIIPTLQACQIQPKVISKAINISDYHAKTASIVGSDGVKSSLAAASIFLSWLLTFTESSGILLHFPHLHLLTRAYKEKHRWMHRW